MSSWTASAGELGAKAYDGVGRSSRRAGDRQLLAVARGGGGVGSLLIVLIIGLGFERRPSQNFLNTDVIEFRVASATRSEQIIMRYVVGPSTHNKSKIGNRRTRTGLTVVYGTAPRMPIPRIST